MRTAAMLLLVPVTLCGCFESYALLADSDRDARDVLETVDGETVDHVPGADADADVDALTEAEDSCCAPDDPMVAACQDGLWCNGPEQVTCFCECMSSDDPVDCDDGDPTTVDWCDETMDVCRHSDDGGDAGADAEADSGTCAGGWYDPSTDLCWQDPPDGRLRSWDDAVTYCTSLALGGHDDWHLPTIGELRSVIRGCPATETGGSCGLTDTCLDLGCWNAACNSECHTGGGPGTGGAYWPPEIGGYTVFWYWSSSSFSDDGHSFAWYVSFSDGLVAYYERSYEWFVRCVRPGP